jgi:hypothetical protein
MTTGSQKQQDQVRLGKKQAPISKITKGAKGDGVVTQVVECLCLTKDKALSLSPSTTKKEQFQV